MTKSNSPYIKFTYTLIGLKGDPQEKSYMLNLSYIVSIESLTNHEIKITMNNGKIVLIDLGVNNKASIVMDDILDLSAVGFVLSVALFGDEGFGDTSPSTSAPSGTPNKKDLVICIK